MPAVVGIAAAIDGTLRCLDQAMGAVRLRRLDRAMAAVGLQPLDPDARPARDQLTLEATGHGLRKRKRSDQLEGYEREQSRGTGAHFA